MQFDDSKSGNHLVSGHNVRYALFFGLAAVILIFAAYGSLFTVYQTKQALATLCRLLDGGVDLIKPPVEIGNVVALDGDPGSERRVLRLKGRRNRTAVADMGGHQLRIDARCVDDGEAGNEGDRVKRHTHAVTPHRWASHPAVTSLADFIAPAMAITDIGEPGNSTTMPLIENQAAAPARAIAAV